MNANSLESGTHQTLDMIDTQNIQPISTRTTETSQTTSTEHDHDQLWISASCEQIVTIQFEKLTTTVDSDKTQILELVTNSPNSLQLPLIDNQLQSSVGPDAEPVITIELETPEDNTPDLNIQPQNKSEDTLSSESFHKEDFPPEYFKQLMMVFQVMRILLMITMKLNQTLVLAICDGIKISNWIPLAIFPEILN